MPTEHCCNYS